MARSSLNDPEGNEEISPKKYRKLREKLRQLEEVNRQGERAPHSHTDHSLDSMLSTTLHNYVVPERGTDSKANTLILISGIMLATCVACCVFAPINRISLIYPLLATSGVCVATLGCAVWTNRQAGGQERPLNIRIRYLGIAYAIFVIGIAATILWFGIALVLSGY